MPDIEIAALWDRLGWPLLRLILGLSAGLMLANILECMRWTDYLAKLAAPLARLAHLGPQFASAFALAFVSPAGANGLLSESYHSKILSLRELVLANLFNSLPANLVHLPTIFFLTWPVLGLSAIIYVGLSIFAAIGRTLFTILLARIFLPKRQDNEYTEKLINKNEDFITEFGRGLGRAWQRFRKRIAKLIYFTVPFYVLIYLAQEYGFFRMAEIWLSDNLAWLTFIKPEAMSIVILQMVAEMGASLGAAGAVLQSGALSPHDVVAAMLAGNLLSTPMRAIRHQFPAYAGFYQPVVAIKLIVANQILRAASVAVVLTIYVVCAP